MTKKYQKDKIDTPTGDGVVVPERVNVAMAEIAGTMREGLLALAVGAGLQVMQALMEADVTGMAGPKGKHDAGRTAVRHGSERGSVTLGGRRVPVSRPRVRAADGSGELSVPTYELFSGTEILGSMAMERMLAGLSTRRYRVGLEPVGDHVSAAAKATSKSAVSRKFVAMTETALAELLAADLSALDLVALMVDGVHFGESCCVVALGIDSEGVKHPLALVEGATENATVVTDLLVGLRDRGLDVSRPILVGIDGAKALRKAVVDVFDHPVIQRCQLHKIRNVQDRLPQRLRGPVGTKMRAAYHADSALEAEAALTGLARELDKTHPSAAASLREGLHETLTVLRLGVPPTLARTLRSTNAIESMISICRDHARNVKRWRDGQMALRWCAAGMVEAGKQFRRVNGHLHLAKLRAALDAEITGTVTPAVHDEEVVAA
ncbi:IS256-like element ISBsa1 family transposase [Blastococcus saxobsidens]|uniref:Mutator family transposase n=1 Tax=Blastococcus saxobsidens (strain DD2) TaxID=1146883 RepID=H6RMB8_BLASD|nr:IS256-like element ISBsa1 family transposase [Blastococcus saxobsidens]CCG02026.1 transposase [Blastococcus saxobsidens DD2]CCG02355.1 transposase [Blastococcus saxobsidens DD2]CCG02364.1 transposase [Blastococcus saxobsidens DD2]CCG02441.1 transposase [Blastococcus saxobsidens DD2]CCG02554.1 transposase [Blastococcus saxobsidens DD2]